jgi:hypothetical protein
MQLLRESGGAGRLSNRGHREDSSKAAPRMSLGSTELMTRGDRPARPPRPRAWASVWGMGRTKSMYYYYRGVSD